MKGRDEHRTLLMIFIMVIAAVTAELIHLEGIISAFIAKKFAVKISNEDQ